MADSLDPKPVAEPFTPEQKRARSERTTLIMWGFVTGGIGLLCNLVHLEGTFIPPGFGVLGLVIAWQLNRYGEKRNSLYAGVLNLASIMIWLTVNSTWLIGLLQR
jgi:hypothetical protein